MTDNCAKFEKNLDSTTFQANYFKPFDVKMLKGKGYKNRLDRRNSNG